MWYFNPPKWPLGNISRMNEYSLPEVVEEASRRSRPLGAENAFFCGPFGAEEGTFPFSARSERKEGRGRAAKGPETEKSPPESFDFSGRWNIVTGPVPDLRKLGTDRLEQSEQENRCWNEG